MKLLTKKATSQAEMWATYKFHSDLSWVSRVTNHNFTLYYYTVYIVFVLRRMKYRNEPCHCEGGNGVDDSFLFGFLGLRLRLLALHNGQIGALRWICWWHDRHAFIGGGCCLKKKQAFPLFIRGYTRSYLMKEACNIQLLLELKKKDMVKFWQYPVHFTTTS